MYHCHNIPIVTEGVTRCVSDTERSVDRSLGGDVDSSEAVGEGKEPVADSARHFSMGAAGGPGAVAPSRHDESEALRAPKQVSVKHGAEERDDPARCSVSCGGSRETFCGFTGTRQTLRSRRRTMTVSCVSPDGEGRPAPRNHNVITTTKQYHSSRAKAGKPLTGTASYRGNTSPTEDVKTSGEQDSLRTGKDTGELNRKASPTRRRRISRPYRTCVLDEDSTGVWTAFAVVQKKDSLRVHGVNGILAKQGSSFKPSVSGNFRKEPWHSKNSSYCNTSGTSSLSPSNSTTSISSDDENHQPLPCQLIHSRVHRLAGETRAGGTDNDFICYFSESSKEPSEDSDLSEQQPLPVGFINREKAKYPTPSINVLPTTFASIQEESDNTETPLESPMIPFLHYSKTSMKQNIAKPTQSYEKTYEHNNFSDTSGETEHSCDTQRKQQEKHRNSQEDSPTYETTFAQRKETPTTPYMSPLKPILVYSRSKRHANKVEEKQYEAFIEESYKSDERSNQEQIQPMKPTFIKSNTCHTYQQPKEKLYTAEFTETPREKQKETSTDNKKTKETYKNSTESEEEVPPAPTDVNDAETRSMGFDEAADAPAVEGQLSEEEAPPAPTDVNDAETRSMGFDEAADAPAVEGQLSEEEAPPAPTDVNDAETRSMGFDEAADAPAVEGQLSEEEVPPAPTDVNDAETRSMGFDEAADAPAVEGQLSEEEVPLAPTDVNDAETRSMGFDEAADAPAVEGQLSEEEVPPAPTDVNDAETRFMGFDEAADVPVVEGQLSEEEAPPAPTDVNDAETRSMGFDEAADAPAVEGQLSEEEVPLAPTDVNDAETRSMGFDEAADAPAVEGQLSEEEAPPAPTDVNDAETRSMGFDEAADAPAVEGQLSEEEAPPAPTDVNDAETRSMGFDEAADAPAVEGQLSEEEAPPVPTDVNDAETRSMGFDEAADAPAVEGQLSEEEAPPAPTDVNDAETRSMGFDEAADAPAVEGQLSEEEAPPAPTDVNDAETRSMGFDEAADAPAVEGQLSEEEAPPVPTDVNDAETRSMGFDEAADAPAVEGQLSEEEAPPAPTDVNDAETRSMGFDEAADAPAVEGQLSEEEEVPLAPTDVNDAETRSMGFDEAADAPAVEGQLSEEEAPPAPTDVNDAETRSMGFDEAADAPAVEGQLSEEEAPPAPTDVNDAETRSMGFDEAADAPAVEGQLSEEEAPPVPTDVNDAETRSMGFDEAADAPAVEGQLSEEEVPLAPTDVNDAETRSMGFDEAADAPAVEGQLSEEEAPPAPTDVNDAETRSMGFDEAADAPAVEGQLSEEEAPPAPTDVNDAETRSMGFDEAADAPAVEGQLSEEEVPLAPTDVNDAETRSMGFDEAADAPAVEGQLSEEEVPLAPTDVNDAETRSMGFDEAADAPAVEGQLSEEEVPLAPTDVNDAETRSMGFDEAADAPAVEGQLSEEEAPPAPTDVNDAETRSMGFDEAADAPAVEGQLSEEEVPPAPTDVNDAETRSMGFDEAADAPAVEGQLSEEEEVPLAPTDVNDAETRSMGFDEAADAPAVEGQLSEEEAPPAPTDVNDAETRSMGFDEAADAPAVEGQLSEEEAPPAPTDVNDAETRSMGFDEAADAPAVEGQLSEEEAPPVPTDVNDAETRSMGFDEAADAPAVEGQLSEEEAPPAPTDVNDAETRSMGFDEAADAPAVEGQLSEEEEVPLAPTDVNDAETRSMGFDEAADAPAVEGQLSEEEAPPAPTDVNDAETRSMGFDEAADAPAVEGQLSEEEAPPAPTDVNDAETRSMGFDEAADAPAVEGQLSEEEAPPVPTDVNDAETRSMGFDEAADAPAVEGQLSEEEVPLAPTDVNDAETRSMGFDEAADAPAVEGQLSEEEAPPAPTDVNDAETRSMGFDEAADAPAVEGQLSEEEAPPAPTDVNDAETRSMGFDEAADAPAVEGQLSEEEVPLAPTDVNDAETRSMGFDEAADAPAVEGQLSEEEVPLAPTDVNDAETRSMGFDEAADAPAVEGQLSEEEVPLAPIDVNDAETRSMGFDEAADAPAVEGQLSEEEAPPAPTDVNDAETRSMGFDEAADAPAVEGQLSEEEVPPAPTDVNDAETRSMGFDEAADAPAVEGQLSEEEVPLAPTDVNDAETRSMGFDEAADAPAVEGQLSEEEVPLAPTDVNDAETRSMGFDEAADAPAVEGQLSEEEAPPAPTDVNDAETRSMGFDEAADAPAVEGQLSEEEVPPAPTDVNDAETRSMGFDEAADAPAVEGQLSEEEAPPAPTDVNDAETRSMGFDEAADAPAVEGQLSEEEAPPAPTDVNDAETRSMGFDEAADAPAVEGQLSEEEAPPVPTDVNDAETRSMGFDEAADAPAVEGQLSEEEVPLAPTDVNDAETRSMGFDEAADAPAVEGQLSEEEAPPAPTDVNDAETRSMGFDEAADAPAVEGQLSEEEAPPAPTDVNDAETRSMGFDEAADAPAVEGQLSEEEVPLAPTDVNDAETRSMGFDEAADAPAVEGQLSEEEVPLAPTDVNDAETRSMGFDEAADAPAVEGQLSEEEVPPAPTDVNDAETRSMGFDEAADAPAVEGQLSEEEVPLAPTDVNDAETRSMGFDEAADAPAVEGQLSEEEVPPAPTDVNDAETRSMGFDEAADAPAVEGQLSEEEAPPAPTDVNDAETRSMGFDEAADAPAVEGQLSEEEAPPAPTDVNDAETRSMGFDEAADAPAVEGQLSEEEAPPAPTDVNDAETRSMGFDEAADAPAVEGQLSEEEAPPAPTDVNDAETRSMGFDEAADAPAVEGQLSEEEAPPAPTDVNDAETRSMGFDEAADAPAVEGQLSEEEEVPLAPTDVNDAETRSMGFDEAADAPAVEGQLSEEEVPPAPTDVNDAETRSMGFDEAADAPAVEGQLSEEEVPPAPTDVNDAETRSMGFDEAADAPAVEGQLSEEEVPPAPTDVNDAETRSMGFDEAADAPAVEGQLSEEEAPPVPTDVNDAETRSMGFDEAADAPAVEGQLSEEEAPPAPTDVNDAETRSMGFDEAADAPAVEGQLSEEEAPPAPTDVNDAETRSMGFDEAADAPAVEGQLSEEEAPPAPTDVNDAETRSMGFDEAADAPAVEGQLSEEEEVPLAPTDVNDAETRSMGFDEAADAPAVEGQLSEEEEVPLAPTDVNDAETRSMGFDEAADAPAVEGQLSEEEVPPAPTDVNDAETRSMGFDEAADAPAVEGQLSEEEVPPAPTDVNDAETRSMGFDEAADAPAVEGQLSEEEVPLAPTDVNDAETRSMGFDEAADAPAVEGQLSEEEVPPAPTDVNDAETRSMGFDEAADAPAVEGQLSEEEALPAPTDVNDAETRSMGFDEAADAPAVEGQLSEEEVPLAPTDVNDAETRSMGFDEAADAPAVEGQLSEEEVPPAPTDIACVEMRFLFFDCFFPFGSFVSCSSEPEVYPMTCSVCVLDDLFIFGFDCDCCFGTDDILCSELCGFGSRFCRLGKKVHNRRRRRSKFNCSVTAMQDVAVDVDSGLILEHLSSDDGPGIIDCDFNSSFVDFLLDDDFFDGNLCSVTGFGTGLGLSSAQALQVSSVRDSIAVRRLEMKERRQGVLNDLVRCLGSAQLPSSVNESAPGNCIGDDLVEGNDGIVPLVDVLVGVDTPTFPSSEERTGKRSRPPGTTRRLRPRKSHVRLLVDDAATLVSHQVVEDKRMASDVDADNKGYRASLSEDQAEHNAEARIEESRAFVKVDPVSTAASSPDGVSLVKRAPPPPTHLCGSELCCGAGTEDSYGTTVSANQKKCGRGFSVGGTKESGGSIESKEDDSFQSAHARLPKKRRKSTRLTPRSVACGDVDLSQEFRDLGEPTGIATIASASCREPANPPRDPRKYELSEDQALTSSATTQLDAAIKDPYYNQLGAVYMSLLSKNDAESTLQSTCVSQLMKERMHVISHDCRKASDAECRLYGPLLDVPTSLGYVVLSRIRHRESVFLGDNSFRKMLNEYSELCKPDMCDERAAKEKLLALQRYVDHVTADITSEEACLREEMPFLTFLESAVPLRDLHLLENPTFTELFARYSGLRNGGGPAADAELKQLERAMCNLASRLAEDEAIARRRRLLEAENLHERYPYVPEEPVPGITLVEVGVLRDAAFCALSNELELLRVNPVANAGRAAAVEEALRTRVVELASARLSAAEKVCESNPFLGMRVDGVLVDELRLNENPEFQELVTRRAAVLAAPDADLEAVAGLENELCRCARAAAVEVKAINALRTDEDEAVRARNPFLEYNEVLTVPLRFLDFEDDGRVKLLKHRRLHYLVVGDNNARLLVEQRLSERVRDIARALYEGENELRNEFITRDSSAEFCNVHLSGLAIEEDEAVAKCMKEANLLRSDESILDPIELEKKEDETRKRILEMTQAYVRAESQVACFLRRLLHKYPASVRDVNPAIQSDDEFSKLESARLGAIASEKCNLDLLNIIENRQFSRSVMLIEDDTYVKLAQDEYLGLESELQKLCSTKPFSSAAGASLCVTRDIAYYNFRLLKARHARRRIAEVPLFPVDDEKLFSLTDEYVAIPTKVVESRVRNDPFSLFLKQNERAVKDSTLAAHTLRLRSTAEVRRQQIAEEEVKMQRVSKRRENAATRKYPMLRSFFESLSRNKIDLNNDKETLRLLSEREALLVPSASLLQSYPHIGRSLDLVRAGNSDLDDKTLLTTLAKEDDDLRQPIEEVLHSVNLKEKQMEERCSQLISAVSAEEACLREEMPFLAFLESAVPLRDLHLLENPTFTELFARYSGLRNGGGPAADAELKQLERAMCNLASRLAEDEAIARRRRLLEAENLHERYPYVPEEPVPGITLVEVGVLRDAAFCALSNELELLRVNPVANAGRAAAVEEALRTRVVELASARLSAAEKVCESNPFLGMRVDGVLVDELRLNENPEFQELVTRRAAVLAAPDADLEAVAGLENELCRCARAAAVEVKAINALRTDEDEAVRARNPFLEYNEVLTVPLRFLDFEDDSLFDSLYQQRLCVLSEEVVDWETVRYFNDMLRERAALVASLHLRKVGNAINSLQERGVSTSVLEARSCSVALNCRCEAGDIFDYASECASADDIERYEVAARDAEVKVALEMRELGLKYPTCLGAVTSDMEHDERFKAMESERRILSETGADVVIVESVERKQKERSVELLYGGQHTEDEENDDPPFPNAAPTASKKELTQQWASILKRQHASLYDMVSILGETEIPVEIGSDTHQMALRRRRRRHRRTHVTGLEFARIPEEVPSEILEKPYLSGDGEPPHDTASNEELYKDPLYGGAGSDMLPARTKDLHKMLRWRRRLSRTHPSTSMKIIPNLVAGEIAENLGISLFGLTNRYSLDPLRVSIDEFKDNASTHSSSHIPRKPPTDPATERWGHQARSRRTRKSDSTTQALSTAVTPNVNAREVVEYGTEYLGSEVGNMSGGCSNVTLLSGARSGTTISISVLPDIVGRYVEDKVVKTVPWSNRGQMRRVEHLRDLPPLTASDGKLTVPSSDPRLATPLGVHKQEGGEQLASSPMPPVATSLQTSTTSLVYKIKRPTKPRTSAVKGSRPEGKPGAGGLLPAEGVLSSLPPLLTTIVHTPGLLTSEKSSSQRRETLSSADSPKEFSRTRYLPKERGAGAWDDTLGHSGESVQQEESLAMRTLDIVPFNHKETEEIERERHLINEAISKATQLVERTVTTEEIENDVEAMKLVFIYEDVSQFYLDQPPLIAASYLKSIKEELIQRVIELSKCPTPADNSPRALVIRQRRRLQLAEVLTMKQRTKGPVDIRSLDTLNPRAVPQPWAHLCSYDLALDHKMDTLMRKHEQTSGFADEIFSYLTELSKRKEAENEAIFAKYPFIPPLPHGVPLSELGLPENDDFQRSVLRLEGCPDDIEAKNEMCRIAVRLAEWRAALRRGVSSPLPKNGQPVLRETLSPAGSKEDGSRDGTTTQSSGEQSSQSGSSSISGVKTLLHSGGELAYGQFIVRCKEDFPRLLEQLRAQMPAQSMDDIHLTTENLEALRFFYDGAIRGNGKTLSYSDLEAFMLLTLGKELGMSVDNIQWLVRTSMVVNHTPRTLKFHDFSGFVKHLAASDSFGSGARGNDLREVPLQNGRHVSESPRHVPRMVDVLLVPESASSSSTTQGTGSQSTVGAASRTQGGTSRTTRLTPLRSSKPHPRHSSAGNSEMAERIVIRRPATTQHASAQEERHVQAPVAALEAQAWTTVSNKGACDVASGAHDVDDKTDGKTP